MNSVMFWFIRGFLFDRPASPSESKSFCFASFLLLLNKPTVHLLKYYTWVCERGKVCRWRPQRKDFTHNDFLLLGERERERGWDADLRGVSERERESEQRREDQTSQQLSDERGTEATASRGRCLSLCPSRGGGAPGSMLVCWDREGQRERQHTREGWRNNLDGLGLIKERNRQRQKTKHGETQRSGSGCLIWTPADLKPWASPSLPDVSCPLTPELPLFSCAEFLCWFLWWLFCSLRNKVGEQQVSGAVAVTQLFFSSSLGKQEAGSLHRPVTVHCRPTADICRRQHRERLTEMTQSRLSTSIISYPPLPLHLKRMFCSDVLFD